MRTPDLRDRLQETALQDQALLLLGAGTDTIRLRPVLDVTEEEIDLLAQRLEAALAALAA
jgi:L-lysine 6-transaminase